jgi:hypothetical protein
MKLLKLAAVGGTLLLHLALAARPAAAASCSTTDGITVVNGLFSTLTPALNQAWPSVAVESGLDPLKNVWDGTINLGCKYGGDEICGAQASSCKKMYATVDVDTIGGLAYLQFDDLEVDTLNAASGTSCPYSSSGTSGPYTCSYSGTGSGEAYLLDDTEITAKISSIKVKVKCSFFGSDFTETLYSGSAKCSASEPSGSATFQYCAGSCQSGSIPAVLSYLTMKDLKLKVDDLSCDVSPNYSPASWIGEILVPELEDEIVAVLTPLIEDALNDTVADFLPFPGKCGS